LYRFDPTTDTTAVVDNLTRANLYEYSIVSQNENASREPATCSASTKADIPSTHVQEVEVFFSKVKFSILVNHLKILGKFVWRVVIASKEEEGGIKEDNASGPCHTAPWMELRNIKW